MIFRKKKKGAVLNLPPNIPTRRLMLRQYVLSDWEEWSKARAENKDNLQVWEPTWSKDVLTMQSFEKRVQFYQDQWNMDQGYSFLIKSRETGELIGGVSLTRISRASLQSAVLGYWCDQKHHRQGYTYEAVHRILEFAFQDLGLHRIQASCMKNNEASLGLLKKAGFQEEGTARGYLKIQGEWTDHLIFSLLKEDVFKEGVF